VSLLPLERLEKSFLPKDGCLLWLGVRLVGVVTVLALNVLDGSVDNPPSFGTDVAESFA